MQSSKVDFQDPEFLASCGRGGLNETLGVKFTSVELDRVEAYMPASAGVKQPFGFVHGGATIALLESVASLGSQIRCNLETELPFGVDVHVRHRKSARGGIVRGVATFNREEPAHGRAGGVKQFWDVAAYDDAGDVMSEGVIVAKVVSKERLAARNAAVAERA